MPSGSPTTWTIREHADLVHQQSNTGGFGYDDVKKAVDDNHWQEFRLSLKGLETHEKLSRLLMYLSANDGSRKCKIQVRNYLNALKRAGLVPT